VSRHVADVQAVLVGTATVISSLDEILNVLNASPDLCRWAMVESAWAREETPAPGWRFAEEESALAREEIPAVAHSLEV